LHGDPDKKEISEGGTRTLENAVSLLNWAVALIGDPDLIAKHRSYLQEQLPKDMRERKFYDSDTDATAQYILDTFEAQINPRKYCFQRMLVETRLSEEVSAAMAENCLVCSTTFVNEDGWQLLGEEMCTQKEWVQESLKF
jgi:hypothetical protein